MNTHGQVLGLLLLLSVAGAQATTWDFVQGLPADGGIRDGSRLVVGRGLTPVEGLSEDERKKKQAGFKLSARYRLPDAFHFEAEFEAVVDDQTTGGYIWDDMYRPTLWRGGLQVRTERSGHLLRPVITLGYADTCQDIRGPRVAVENGEIVRLAFDYDAQGSLVLDWGGRTTVHRVNVTGPVLAPQTYAAILGDTVNANQSPLEGYLRRVTVEPYVRPACLVLADGRLSYERAEPEADACIVVRNLSDGVLGALSVRTRQFSTAGASVAESEAPLAAIAVGEQGTLRVPVETRLVPGRGVLEVCVTGEADGMPFACTNRFSILVGKRFAERLPVVMWGYGNRYELTDFGFTHGTDSSQTFGFSEPPTETTDVVTPLNQLDRALKAGLRVLPTARVRLPADASDGRYYRWTRDGSFADRIPEVSQPALVDYSRQVIRADIRVMGEHPALGGVLAVSEQRDDSFPSFNTEDDRFTAETGLAVPDEVTGRRPALKTAQKRYPTGIVPEDDPLYVYYRWFWKGGDGWPGYSGAIADEYRAGVGRQPFFSFHDPAVRVPPVWGSGGNVDVLSHWCYAYPEPMNVAGPLEELFAMAEGRPGQKVMIQTQVICYRSQIAPMDVTVASPPEWLARLPDAAFVAIPPDVLQESTWAMIAKPVSGIMYHGLGCIVDTGSQDGYCFTNPDCPVRIRQLLRNVVAPLGPSLLKIGRRPPRVAVMESGVTGMLGGPVSYGWSAPSVTFFQRARLDPKVVYEESILSNGLDGVEVLYVPQLQFTTQAVVDRLAAFQRAGGILVGDSDTLKAVTPDIVAPLVKFSAPPLKDTAEAIDILVQEEGTDVDTRSATVNAKLTMQKQADEIRAALAAKGFVSAAGSSTSEIFVFNRQWQETPYLFAVNDKREFGDYVGQWGCVMEKGCPVSGEVSLSDADGAIAAVYELSRGTELPFSRVDGRVVVPLTFETNDGRLLVFLKERIAAVSLAASPVAARGEPIDIEFRVLGTSGSPVEAVLPVEIHVYDASGRELDGAGYAAAEGGVCRLTVPTDVDDPAGEYRIEAVDRASGLRAVTRVPQTAGGVPVVSGSTSFVRWEADSVTFGENRLRAVCRDGRAISVEANAADGETVVVYGEPVAFAADAIVRVHGGGLLVFSNDVSAAGAVTFAGNAPTLEVNLRNPPWNLDLAKVEGEHLTVADLNGGREVLAFPGVRNVTDYDITSVHLSYEGSSFVDYTLSQPEYPERTAVSVSALFHHWDGGRTRCVQPRIRQDKDGAWLCTVHAWLVQKEDWRGYDFRENTDRLVQNLCCSGVTLVGRRQDDRRTIAIAGAFAAGGEIRIEGCANLILGREAVAGFGSTFAPGIVFDNGRLVFRDAGDFTFGGTVTGSRGDIRYELSDGEAPPADFETEVVPADLPGTADTLLLANTELASVTGLSARIYWRQYNNDGEQKMAPEMSGWLEPVRFRNTGASALAWFHAVRSSGSQSYQAVLTFTQVGRDVLARKSAGYASWWSNQPGARDIATWNPLDDPGSKTGYPAAKFDITDLVVRLSSPSGRCDRVQTLVVLDCTNTVKNSRLSYAAGRNRRLQARILSAKAGPSAAGNCYADCLIESNATVHLDAANAVWSTGIGGANGLTNNVWTVAAGGALCSYRRIQFGAFQTLDVRGGRVVFRADTFSASADAGYLKELNYADGGRTEGGLPTLGYMATMPEAAVRVRGNAPALADHNLTFFGGETDAAKPVSWGVTTFDVADVTGDGADDLTVSGGLTVVSTCKYQRFVKTGDGTMFVRGGVSWADSPLELQSGVLGFGAVSNAVKSLTLAGAGGLRLADGVTLQIGDSSAETWSAEAALDIRANRKTCHIGFGQSASALTPGQLKQIRWNGCACTLAADGTLIPVSSGTAVLVR